MGYIQKMREEEIQNQIEEERKLERKKEKLSKRNAKPQIFEINEN
jgi:hypothetical protein